MIPHATMAIAAALLLSLATNVVTTRAYLAQRDQAAQAIAQRDQARADASACSDATEALRELADKRTKAAAPARLAAATAAQTHQVRADYTLGLQPRLPGDLCGSLQALGDEWLAGRGKP